MQTKTALTQAEHATATPRVTHEPSTGGTATFVDNRPSTVRQRKLQEAMTVQRSSTHPPQDRRAPQGSSRFQQIATAMGRRYGVDTSPLKATHNSSFPATLNAEATIQGNKVHFAPGRDTDYNIKHEVAHAIDNTLNGTPKGDQVVQGQRVDTTRERLVGRMAQAPIDTPLLQRRTNYPSSPGFGFRGDVVQRNGFAPGTPGPGTPNPIFYKPYFEAIGIFTAALQRLMEASHIQLGQPTWTQIIVRTILPLPTRFRKPIYNAFLTYFTGKPIEGTHHQADMTRICLELLAPHLDTIFGAEDLAAIKRQHKLDRGWEDITNPKGGLRFYTYGDVLHEVGDDYKQIRDEMLRLYSEQLNVLHPHQDFQAGRNYEILTGPLKRFAGLYREWVESGTNLHAVHVNRGQTFYKLMGRNRNYKTDWSAYHLDSNALNSVLLNTRFMGALGLPLLSYEPVYALYKIKALRPATVFKSTVARTKQQTGRRASGRFTWENPGSILQTLIVDNRNNLVWRKDDTPIAIIDPDEQAGHEITTTARYTNPQ